MRKKFLSTMRRIVHKDLKMKILTIKKRQALTATQKLNGSKIVMG